MYIPLTFEGALQKCLFASGGVEGYFISGSEQYKYHWFTGSAELTVQKGTIDDVDILVVGGGGGGSYGLGVPAGGGGGGGVMLSTNGRLFAGTYYVTVGRGGGGGGVSSVNSNVGDSGLLSRFRGINVDITANGGQGGNFGSGNSGGTSGNGFAGKTNTSTTGGGGGGANAAATNQDGGIGIPFSVNQYETYYGCGGGGGLTFNGDYGVSCAGPLWGCGSDTTRRAESGAPHTGMGGGGSLGNYLTPGGDGASGSVIVLYKIYDYCNNYFNETGSCGCREITFDVSDTLNYKPQYTGSYVYTPCGGNNLVSGSVLAYAPVTVCASSGSYYWQSGFNSTTGMVTTGPMCSTGSQCVTQSFVPTCESKVYSFYATGSTANQTAYFVPKNSGSVFYETIPNKNVVYRCISSGSFNQLGTGMQPYGISGNGNAVTASCTQISVVRISASPYTFKWVDCGGSYVTQSITTTYTFSKCVDRSQPYDFDATNGSITIGGDCLTGSLLPPCGCP